MAMENRTGMNGWNFSFRMGAMLEAHHRVVWLAVCTAAGYIMACSRIFGGAAPFGVALCAMLRAPYSVGGAVGALLGYALGDGDAIKYISAVLLVLALQWLFAGRFDERFATAESALIALLALGGAGTASVVFYDGTLYDVLLMLAEVCLCAGASYFFSRAVDTIDTGWAAATRSDLSCLVVSFAVVVMGLCSIAPGGLSVGRIVSALVILLCARISGEAGGAISGISAGIAIGLSGGDYAYAISAYGFGGLMAGVFAGLGRIAAAGAFILINTVAGLFTRSPTDIYFALGEIFFASVIFAAIPQSVMARLRTARLGRVLEAELSAQGALRGRLSEISGSLREIGQTTREVGQRLSRLEQNDPGDIPVKVSEKICANCASKTICWQLKYTDTMNALNDAMTQLRREGSLCRDDLPPPFLARCGKSEAFAAELNIRFGAQLAKEQVQRKVARVRAVINDQFEGIAQMLEELAGELCDVTLLDAPKLRYIREYFEQEGFAVQQVRGYTGANDRITVEVSFPGFEAPKLDGAKAAIDLSGLLEAELDLPHIALRQRTATAIFMERATFRVDIGLYQIAPEGNRLCGDACEQIANHRGRAHLILSDGMGCGGGAAVDSHMATGLLSQLISVGFGHDAALNMVNAALLVKSGEESLATIDVCSIDLYSGRADLFKAGAAPTFLLRGGSVSAVESTSLPAGILHSVSFDRSGCTLRENDIIVMVSDGVTATGADWVRSELASLDRSDMQRMAEKLAMTAKVRRTDGREDDITVLAAALRRGA